MFVDHHPHRQQSGSTTSRRPKMLVSRQSPVGHLTGLSPSPAPSPALLQSDMSHPIGAMSRVTVDCYDGPLGQGYALAEEVVLGAQTWRRVEQVGPETWRALDWSVLQPFTGVTLGALNLSATFASIGIELTFVEAGLTLKAVGIEYRRSGTLAWKPALPLHLTYPAAQQAAGHGSVLRCDPGTSYDVRATAWAGDAWTTLVGTVTTRSEEIPPASTLTPTHYVSVDGSDSNNGLTPETAWRTIEKAQGSAPAEAVVQVGPGYFVGQETPSGSAGRFQPITFVAQYPALDDDRNVINQGRHTVIEGSLRAGPAGNGVVTEAPWTQVTLTGPTTGQRFTVWRWTGTGTGVRYSLGYGATREAIPQRVAHWKRDTLRLATPEGWAELVATNRTQRHGYHQSAAGDLYLYHPNVSDPNTLWWTAGVGCAFATSAPDCRWSGFVVRGFDIGVQAGPFCDRFIVDHCYIQTVNHGVKTIGSYPSTYIEDPVIRHNLLVNTGIWSDDQEHAPTVAWVTIKGQIKLADGSRYPTTRIAGALEGVGLYVSACRRADISHNTIEGFQNGIGSMTPIQFDRYAGSEYDVYDNLIRRIQDDAIEPEMLARNWRIWGNRVEQTLTFLSTGPSCSGPLYVWDNVAWRVGMAGLPRDLDGIVDGAASIFFKYSRASNPQARVYVISNTFWTDDELGGSGGSQFASGSGLAESFYLRNNIFRVMRSGFEWWPGATGAYDEDYNQFSTADAGRGMKLLSPQTTYTTFEAYRTASGQGGHSNLAIDLHDVVTLDAQFVDAAGGDLQLRPDSVLRALGCDIPMLCDRVAPDVGCSG